MVNPPVTVTQKIRAFNDSQSALDLAVEQHRSSAQRLKALIPRKPRIVVLEDDHNMLASYQRLFAGLAEIVPLKRPSDLAPYLKNNCIDLILTDSAGLPGIRSIRRYAPDVSIVVISGGEKPDHLPEGVSMWVEKPFDPKSLYSMVERELNSYGDTLI